MDIFDALSAPAHEPITCIDMHTTGEPTRIIIKGYPELTGTLLEQRAKAKENYDHVRERVLLEPRGHFDMYGAILRRDTELTRSGEAHIGVLFMTNELYSTMCGHATIALGRFLVDTHDLDVFPNREKVVHSFDSEGRASAVVNLHAPCGLVVINVPTASDGSRSDPSRPVSFLSVPSYASGIHVRIPIPSSHRWPELGVRDHVVADFAYGGAFYCIVAAKELGFEQGLASVDLDATDKATRLLKEAVNWNTSLHYLFRHGEHEDLGFLYSVILTDRDLVPPASKISEETGLCYFADQQVDRSPTGSAVAARMALAHAKGETALAEARAYHSLVSVHFNWNGGFKATIQETTRGEPQAVRVAIEGRAYYTGVQKLILEDADMLGKGGFAFSRLGSREK